MGQVAGLDGAALANRAHPLRLPPYPPDLPRTPIETNQHRVAVRLASSGTAGGAERLARTDRRHAATADEWDADPWLLNTPGGVVDLRTGQVRTPSREDRMTKLTTATPMGECPAGARFWQT